MHLFFFQLSLTWSFSKPVSSGTKCNHTDCTLLYLHLVRPLHSPVTVLHDTPVLSQVKFGSAVATV